MTSTGKIPPFWVIWHGVTPLWLISPWLITSLRHSPIWVWNFEDFVFFPRSNLKNKSFHYLLNHYFLYSVFIFLADWMNFSQSIWINVCTPAMHAMTEFCYPSLADNKLSDNVEGIREENFALKVEVTKLKQENHELLIQVESGWVVCYFIVTNFMMPCFLMSLPPLSLCHQRRAEGWIEESKITWADCQNPTGKPCGQFLGYNIIFS